MVNILIRLVALSFYVFRVVYWFITEYDAQRKKPKKNIVSIRGTLSKVCTYGIDVLIIFQLSGLSVVSIQKSALLVQVIGLFFVIIGVSICILARKEIADNWVHGAEYQIKNNQALVTTGVYTYIRHPIYLGAALSYIGAEMVAGSYLFLSFFAFLFVFYIQSKREEKILLAHFGERYKEYMKRTKMMVPFVF